MFHRERFRSPDRSEAFGQAGISDLLAPRAVSGPRAPATTGLPDLSTLTPPQRPGQEVFSQLQQEFLSPDFKGLGLPESLQMATPVKELFDIKQLTPGQFTGLAALSSGLQAGAAIRDIRQQETATRQQQQQQLDLQLGRINDEFQRAFRNLEFNQRLRQVNADTVATRRNLAALDALERQGSLLATGQQRQTFFRSPTTGRTI